MGLENVGGLAMHMILSKLSPTEAAAVCCVGKQFLYWASDDSIWAHFCSIDLNLSQPLDPSSNPSPSFKAAYRAWREAFAKYPWPLVKRANACWYNLRQWCTINYPEILPTLGKGVSEYELDEFENTMKVKLPLPTRVLYRFCDGQQLSYEEFKLNRDFLGIIGGYTVYNHFVNVYLLPLSQVKVHTRRIMQSLGFSRESKYLVVATSCTHSEKIFFLNHKSGQLYVGTRNLVTDGEMLPCVPEGLIRNVHDSRFDQSQDAMLLWLEEHVRRLQDGNVRVRSQGKIRSICLFPEHPPLCTAAVTNGVKVRASAVLLPEISDLQDDSEKYLFGYSVRLSVSPDGCSVNGMNFGSCQLHGRHWHIRVNDNVESEAKGEGVIGQFPLLRPGEEEFVYQSCASLSGPRGSIEGSLTFVPGRLAEPKGSPFTVEVARCPFQLPDYIF